MGKSRAPGRGPAACSALEGPVARTCTMHATPKKCCAGADSGGLCVSTDVAIHARGNGTLVRQTIGPFWNLGGGQGADELSRGQRCMPTERAASRVAKTSQKVRVGSGACARARARRRRGDGRKPTALRHWRAFRGVNGSTWVTTWLVVRSCVNSGRGGGAWCMWPWWCCRLSSLGR